VSGLQGLALAAWLAIAATACVGLPSASYAGPQLWQTNARGDDIHVFDVGSRRLTHRLVVGPEPHGIASPQDGRVVLVSLEANGRARGELLWIDPSSFEIRHRLPVGPEPHAIAVTPDGRWVYVPCRDEHYWVVDARRREVVTRIHTGGRPHNTQISRDGRFAFLSPMGEPARVTIVDIQAGHRVVGEIPFAGSVRPPALSANGRKLFQHVDGLNGFQVADVAERRVVATIEHDRSLGWFAPHPKLGWLGPSGFQRCHGLAIRPGHSEIWSVCGAGVAVHDIASPAYEQRAHVELETKGYWITFALDGGLAFIAQSDAGRVAVVDAVTKRVVADLAVGRGPKRNLVVNTMKDLPKAE
jgi:hypothetical protein